MRPSCQALVASERGGCHPLDLGEHVAGEQDTPVGEQDRGVPDALSVAIACARSRASVATCAQAAVA